MSILRITYECGHAADFPSITNDTHHIGSPCPECKIHPAPVASQIESALGYGVREFGVCLEESARIHPRRSLRERVRRMLQPRKRKLDHIRPMSHEPSA